MPWPVHPNGLLGAQGDNDAYKVERSLRFNSGDSAYLNRTPGSASNRKTWTWSGWVKRGLQSADHVFFGNTDGSGYNGLYFQFTSTNKIQIGDYGVGSWEWQIVTTPVYRDSSAWYHLVATIDTTQATAANRVKIYINGSQITSLDTSSYPSQNADLRTNTTQLAAIGRIGSYNGFYFDGYLAEINFIDGQALTPSSFGKTDAVTGRWKAKAYSGTYGTNGFYLKFADNSSTAALGTDSSGNGNTWTPNNFSVTAGAGNDSLVDSPTNYGTDTGAGGEVRGNYCTLNPLKNFGITLSNGNTDGTSSAATRAAIYGTMGVLSGKWYWEIRQNSVTGVNALAIGIGNANATITDYPGSTANEWIYYADGTKTTNAATSAYGASFTTGDVIGVALDADAGTLVFYKNNTSQGTAFTSLTSGPYFPAIGDGGNPNAQSWSANFGQRPFAYTAPTGFKALCTTNLIKATAITTSGSFVGNVSADGPFVYLNGIPTAMTINGNAVTFGSQADKLSNGFKVRTTSTSYNSTGTNNFSVSTTAQKFKFARAQAN